YYFLFGRNCTELLTNLQFACTCLEIEIETENTLQLQRQIDKCIKDDEYILFKLIAPAALLSSEHRHNFFNVYYKKINVAFEPFRGLESGNEKEDMRQLHSGLTDYCKQVEAGLKECFTQLQELGV